MDSEAENPYPTCIKAEAKQSVLWKLPLLSAVTTEFINISIPTVVISTILNIRMPKNIKGKKGIQFQIVNITSEHKISIPGIFKFFYPEEASVCYR